MTLGKTDTRGYWKVGNTAIYVPSTNTKVEHSNVAGSSTGRDESGVMHIDWLRRDVRKVYLHYYYLTASEVNTLLNLLQGKEFVFTFRDKGSTQTMNAYVGESSYEFYSYGVNGEEIYKDVSINVIEK